MLSCAALIHFPTHPRANSMIRSPAPVWRIAAALAVAIPSWSQPQLIEAPDPADPMAVHVYRLENGLTVYLSENDQKPRFHAEIAVRAGSKHDPEISTGIAHYLEHMLFKGTTRLGTLDFGAEKVHLDSITTLYERHFAETDTTRRRQLYALINEQGQLGSRYAVPGELDRIYAALGAEGLNAHTWIEETVYKVDLPANRLLHWARLEAERFSQPVFRLFQTELETVYEEKNRSLDNKDRLIREAVNRRLFKVHPYGQQTTLGSEEHLKNPSLKLMYEFYRTWYVPNNMAVVISGDIDVEETIALIEREFSAWEPRRLPKRKKWKEKKLKEVERVEVFYPGEEYVLLAFRTAPSRHKHTEALQVLDYILDNATAGLINLNLNQKQLVRRAGSWTTSHHNSNDLGAQYLYGVPKEGQSLEEVEALLLEQVELIKSGEFEDWIIPRHRHRLEEGIPPPARGEQVPGRPDERGLPFVPRLGPRPPQARPHGEAAPGGHRQGREEILQQRLRRRLPPGRGAGASRDRETGTGSHRGRPIQAVHLRRGNPRASQ